LIAKHFIPPIAVNAFLGTVLWATYAESSNRLEPHIGNHPIILAAASGAIAGGSQAFVAAPAENVRIIIEGGTKGGWTHAWKEVFRGTTLVSPALTKEENLRDIRQVREWMKDVRGMAGRGWDGWGFGVVKDIFGLGIHDRDRKILMLFRYRIFRFLLHIRNHTPIGRFCEAAVQGSDPTL
jgi:hypothetical protein